MAWRAAAMVTHFLCCHRKCIDGRVRTGSRYRIYDFHFPMVRYCTHKLSISMEINYKEIWFFFGRAGNGGVETSNKFYDLYERLHSVQWKISKHILPKFSWREGLDTRSMIRAGRKMLAPPHPPPPPRGHTRKQKSTHRENWICLLWTFFPPG